MLTVETVWLSIFCKSGERAQQEVRLDVGRHNGPTPTTLLAQAGNRCSVGSGADPMSREGICLLIRYAETDFNRSGDSQVTASHDSFLVKPKDMSVLAFLELSGVAAPSALRFAPLSSKPRAVSSLANASAETLPPVACTAQRDIRSDAARTHTLTALSVADAGTTHGTAS